MPISSPIVHGLSTGQIEVLRRLCALYRVELAVIFGSRARNQATESSDLDIMVLPASSQPFDLLGFEAEAQRIMGRPRVDITVLHPELSSALAWEALREAIVLWEEAPGTYDRVTDAWHDRFLGDAQSRRAQAAQLARQFRCR